MRFFMKLLRTAYLNEIHSDVLYLNTYIGIKYMFNDYVPACVG